MLRFKGPHKPEHAYGIVRMVSLMINTDLIDTIFLVTQKLHYCLLYLYFNSKSRGQCNHWIDHELSGFQQPAVQTTAQKFLS